MVQEVPTDIVPPDISHLVIEDDAPLDNFISEKQQRLLTEVFYSSWLPPTGWVSIPQPNLLH